MTRKKNAPEKPLTTRLGRAWRHAEPRLLVLLVLGVTMVGLLEPLLWTHFEHSRPPKATGDIVALITVVLTVVSIVLAVFGVVVFQIVDRRSQERLERQARELETDFLMKTTSVNANMLLNVGVQAWRLYEESWRRADPPYSSRGTPRPELHRPCR